MPKTHRRSVPTGRLRSGSDYRVVLEGGRRQSGGRLVVYVLAGEGPAKAGFVCGRRVGGAVARNRARRILKEAWRKVFPTVLPGTHVVFVASSEIAGARMPELCREMEELLSSLKAMR